MVAQQRTAEPHNLEAEKTVLGCLLADPDAMLRIRSRLSAMDFFDPVYRAIYKTCEKVFDAREPIDFVTVANALNNDDKIKQIGGSAFLADLAASVPTTSHVEHYASIVREKSGHRSLAKAGRKIASLGNDIESSFSEAFSAAQSELLNLGQSQIQQSKQSLGEVAAKRYEAATEAQAGGDAFEKHRLFSGFPNIDSFFDGFEPDSLTVIAGRPSMGKTALMLNMGMNAAIQDGKRVLFLSLEMSKEQLVDRLISSRLKVSMSKVRRGDLTDKQLLEIGTIVEQFEALPIHIEDQVNTTVGEILAKAMQHQLEFGLDALVIDYLQLIGQSTSTSKQANRVERFSDISRELKALPRTLQVPVIVGSQLSRAVETRPDKTPQLSDIRESGSIEQDADNVLMLYREGYYNPDCENPDLTTIFIRKNRQGGVGAAELMFLKETTTFASIDRVHGGGEF